MASRYLDLINNRGTYAIGALNSQWAKPLANGAKALEKMENFILVEAEYDENGERGVKILTDSKKDSEVFLLTAVERRIEEAGETLSDFYIAKDEDVRVHIIDKSMRFETSHFVLDTGVTAVKEGLCAYFDTTTKKYKIIDPKAGAVNTEYTASGIKFRVVDADTELGFAEARQTIRLEVI